MLTSEAFQIIFLVYFIDYIGGFVPLASGECIDSKNEYVEDCKEKTSFFLTNQQSLKIDLYYDYGTVTPDYFFVTGMCEARKNCNKVTYLFHVGASVKRGDDGVLQCPNENKDVPDCLYPILEACASKLLNDFTEFVCCFHNFPDPNDDKADEKCFSAQQADKLEEYKSCVQLKHPTIKPEEVLLQNSQDAQAKFPNAQCRHPFLTFNEQSDEECTRNAFRYESKKVICAMLAAGVEGTCN